jgi:MFS family permease
MSEKSDAKKDVKKFAGIEIPPDLTKGNFFFLYFNTLVMGMIMAVPAIVQPAFLTDIIKIDQAFAGSINGLLQNMSQIATLLFVAAIGVLSDKVGRKILAFAGFVVVAVFFYLMSQSNGIATGLNIPASLSSPICALLSFFPSRAAEFNAFSPGLLMTYITRFIIGVGLILAYPQFITMVADYTYEKDRGKGMAMNGIAMGIASLLVFGAFAPIMKKSGVVNLIYIICLLAVIGAGSTWVFLKDRMPEVKQKKTGLKEIIPIVTKSLPLKASYLCSLITRADIVVLSAFLLTWAVKYGNAIAMASKDATMKGSIPMIIMGVFSLLAFPVVGILLDKWGRVQTIILALFAGGIGMIILAVCPNPFSGLVYLAVVLAAFGMAGSIAGANTLAADASPPGMLGGIMGGLNTMQPIGVLFFLGLGGYLFDKFGPGWAFGLKGVGTIVLAVWVFMVKDGIKAASEEAAASITFTMKWTDGAKKMLDKVPTAFRQPAVDGTEQYAKDHNNAEVTEEVMAAFRKELGM